MPTCRVRLAVVALLLVTPQLLAQTPATGPAALTGQVLSAAGAPVEKATIVALSSPGGDTSILATATSNAAGRFTLAPAAAPTQSVAFLPTVGFAPPLYSSDNAPLLFQLAPAIDCQVSLQLPDGSPAANIPVRPTVILFADPASPVGIPLWLPESISKQLAVTTDAAGHALFHGLPKSATARFDIDDPRFAHIPPDSQAPLEGDPALIHITLPRLLAAASISGRLINPETHQPLAPCKLGARGIDPRSVTYGRATSDADGNFTLDRLAPGTYAVSMSDPASQATGFVAPPLEMQLAPGQHAAAAFALSHGALLRGQVLDKESGRGITGATIGVYSFSTPKAYIIHNAPVDAAGHFQLRVPPGNQRAYIMDAPDDYLRLPNQGRQELTLADGQTSDLLFSLAPDPAPLIEGTVIGPDQQPLPNASVSIESRDRFGLRYAAADKEGKFHLHANPGTLLRAGFKDLATPQPVPAVADKPMTLRLEKKITFTLTVTLVDEDNHPVPTASLRLTTIVGESGLATAPHPADKTGVVRIEKMPVDGRFEVSGTAPGFGVSQQPIQQLPKGNPYDTVLVLHPESSEIAGTVADGEGHPVANIQVELNGSETGVKTTTTDAAGHFSFSVVPAANNVLVYVRLPDGVGRPVNAKAGQIDLHLTTTAVVLPAFPM